MSLGFVVLQSKQGTCLGQSIINQAVSCAKTSTGCQSLDFAQWASPQSSTIVLYWIRGVPGAQLALGPTRPRLNLFSGYVRLQRRVWLDSELQDFNDAVPDPAALRRDLGGVFCLLTIAPDLTEVQTPISNLQHCYHSEARQYHVLSNSAMVAHLLATGADRPRPAAERLGSLVACRWQSHWLTPYENVRLVPGDRVARLTRDGLAIGPELSAQQFDGVGQPLAESTLDDIAAELLDSLAPLERAGSDRSIGITGGKDSRLLLAAAHHRGLVNSCHTSGKSGHPDVVIGKRVAQALGLEHVATDTTEAARMPDLTRLREAAASAMRSFDLARDAWNPAFRPFPSKSDELTQSERLASSGVTGYGGELLRGGFLKGKQINGDLKGYVLAQFKHYFLRFDDILSVRAREFHRQFLDENFISHVHSSSCPGALLDRVYLQLRCGVWAAAGQGNGNNTAGERIVPLADNRLLRIVLGTTNTMQRANDMVVTQITNRLCPELKAIPTLSELSTSELRNGGRIDEQSLNYWKYMAPTTLQPEFTSVIFSDAAAEGGLWDIVDRRKFESLYGSNEVFKNPRIKQLWSVYSLALVCTSDWVSNTPLPASRVSMEHVLYTHNWSRVHQMLITEFSSLQTGQPEGRHPLLAALLGLRSLRNSRLGAINAGRQRASLQRKAEVVRERLRIDSTDWRTYLRSLRPPAGTSGKVANLYDAIYIETSSPSIEHVIDCLRAEVTVSRRKVAA